MKHSLVSLLKISIGRELSNKKIAKCTQSEPVYEHDKSSFIIYSNRDNQLRVTERLKEGVKNTETRKLYTLDGKLKFVYEEIRLSDGERHIKRTKYEPPGSFIGGVGINRWLLKGEYIG